MYSRVQRTAKKADDSSTNIFAPRTFKVETRPQDDANENTVVQNKGWSSYRANSLLTNIEILRPDGDQPAIQPKLQIQPQREEATESDEPQRVNEGSDFLTNNNDVIQNKEQPTDLNTQNDYSRGWRNIRITPENPPPPPLGIQMKLTIGQPGDKYEQEADRVAADVVQRINAPQSENEPAQLQTKEEQSERIQRDMAPMIPKISIFPPGVSSPPPPAIQMKLSIREPGEEREPTLDQPIYTPVQPLIQRVNIGGMAASPDVEAGIQRARSGGQPLADSIREPMEQAFGADFSGVRVHTDAQADQLNQSIQAKAFTTGQDVFFRQGAYEPGSRGGQELLAHELTHVVQQGRGMMKQPLLDDVQKKAIEEPNEEKDAKTEKQTGRPEAIHPGVEKLSGYSRIDVLVQSQFLHAFGNRTNPRNPRRGDDIQVDNDGNVAGQDEVAPLEHTGASTFTDVNFAPLRGHYHYRELVEPMPEGLGVVADGREVGGEHAQTHHTIYPRQKMTFDQFVDRFQQMGWQYRGKK
ncbi:MAG: DUF4157 domain-containing protein [Nostoc sp. TH1S01]|nr:DUF4157 domain-containing protein [Nostoc sp. TH1S01]